MDIALKYVLEAACCASSIREFDKANEYCRWVRELQSKLGAVPRRIFEDDIFICMTTNEVYEGDNVPSVFSLFHSLIEFESLLFK